MDGGHCGPLHTAAEPVFCSLIRDVGYAYFVGSKKGPWNGNQGRLSVEDLKKNLDIGF